MRRIALSCRGIEKIYNPGTLLETHALVKSDLDLREIGRASCRERV